MTTRPALGCALALLLALCSTPARAEPLLLRARAWNGLSELGRLASEAGVPVAASSRLEVSALAAEDALLIVHPEGALPVSELAAFLRRGGRLAIADDFGRGDTLLRTFGIGRALPDAIDEASVLRGNLGLLLARRQSEHPLSRGVLALATNHPAVLHHPALAPVFALGERRGAVVLSGAVGDGRLVAISDSSVLINNMLELDDNRRFAANLVRYLSAERGGTLYLADSETRIVGALGAFDTTNPLRGVSDALARMAVVELPRSVVIALTALLVLLLLSTAITALPRRTSYERRAIEVPECRAGFAGRVRQAERARGDYLAPLLTFRQELERELLHALGLPPLSTRRRELLDALRKRRMSQAEVDSTRELLETLDALQLETQAGARRIPQRKFVELVAVGRRILTRLASLPAPDQAWPSP